MVLVVKNLLANVGGIRDVGLIPRLGRSPGGLKLPQSRRYRYLYLETQLFSMAP